MLRTLITETYGGKIDHEGDFKLLRQLVDNFFTPDAFEKNFRLVDTEGEVLAAPEGVGMKEFMEWVNALPEREPPTYLGLPANAEKLLLVEHGKGMIQNLGIVQGVLEEGEAGMADAA